ncbi:MAG TPA: DUF4351 domain-containing protein [Tepidisphaeraceae bacterium]|jgi:hypothetical protein|nr:DUF4351 domain-containing protein [Tepidisphaeraceae bacterium]
MDHDKIFKQLLKTFFVEFIALFLPELAAYLSRDKIEFLDKEIFTDLAGGSRAEVDLVAKCAFRDTGACFIIHVEDQNNSQPRFGRRMFHYFARLDGEYGLPVYPIAVLSYDAPLRAEPDVYIVEFPDLSVLKFKFRTIQLNRLNWKDFAETENPVASALMAKMHIEAKDRASVKLACMRMMLRIPLNAAQRALIREFIDSYLRLNAAERAEYEQKTDNLNSPEKENVMAMTNEWTEAGMALGEKKMLLKLLQRQLGDIPLEVAGQIEKLSNDATDALANAVFSIKSAGDLEDWLASHG